MSEIDANTPASTQESVSEADRTAENKPNIPSPKRKNRWMVVGVVVAVLVIVGASFYVWHEQPSFCNAICHKPMDVYVQTYEQKDPGMLVTPHAQAGLNCLSCHEAKLTQQITEVCAWVSDDFPMTDAGYLAHTDGSKFANEETCLKSGCHNWNDVVDATWGFAGNDAKYNPHSSHQDGSIQCSDCHKSHEKSQLYCGKCHQLNAPEGWEVTSE